MALSSDRFCSQVWELIEEDDKLKACDAEDTIYSFSPTKLVSAASASTANTTQTCGAKSGGEMDNRNSKNASASASVSSSSKKKSLKTNKKICNRNMQPSASEHDSHIWTERERRKRMRIMFSTLHSLLPHLAPKTDKSSIVDEAIGYIKSLEQSVQVLQLQKEKIRSCAHRAFHMQECAEHALQTWSSPNVVLSVCGEDAQIGICTTRRPGQLAAIFSALDKHNVDVITAQISGDSYRCMYMIHAHASMTKAAPALEAFKLVTGDLLCIFGDYSSCAY